MNFDEILDRRNTGSMKWDIAPGPVDPGRHIIPLSVADMEFRSPKGIRDALAELAEAGIWGYTGPRPEYYAALDRWFSLRHGFPINKDWVVPAIGVVQAVFSAVRAFSEEGGKVLIQTPVYYPFYRAVEENGRTLLTNPLVIREGHYEVDFERLEATLKEADIFILCSPHNPVSRVWTEEEIGRMAKLAAEHEVFVISDEIHSDFSFVEPHTVFTKQARHYGSRHLLALSASKTFSLAGLGVSSIIIEDPSDRELFKKRIRLDGVHTHSTFGFAAAEAAYTRCDDWYEAMLDYVWENYLALKDFTESRMPQVCLFDLEGTYLAWMDFSPVCSDHEELEQCMVEENLYLDEGYIFGEAGKGFERVNLACPRAVLLTALERLEKVYDKLIRED